MEVARDSSAGMSFIRFPSPVSIFLPRLKKRATPAFQRGLCVCTYVGTFECGGVHMHMCGRGQRTTLVVIPQTPPSPLFLRQGLSLDWNMHSQLSWVARKIQGFTPGPGAQVFTTAPG